MDVGTYIKQLRHKKGISQEELGKVVGVQRAAVQKWETGQVQNLKRKTIQILADYFEVSPASFVVESSNLLDISDASLYPTPIFENVSAGFGAAAIDYIVDYIALPFNSKSEADETICIKVRGDSMSPKIMDGDLIQVHKQTSVDSGDIAVVLLDGDNGFVKKVEYGTDFIKLVSLNMGYEPILLKGAAVQRCSVVGKVKRIIRDL